MGMRVICRYCKSKIEKKDALQIPGEKYNTYYCNKECYSNYFAEKEMAKNENEAAKKARELERLAKKQKREEIQRAKEETKKAREEAKKIKEEQKEASAVRKAKRDAVYDELCDIFGYEIQNTVLFSEWVLWNKLADDSPFQNTGIPYEEWSGFCKRVGLKHWAYIRDLLPLKIVEDEGDILR